MSCCLEQARQTRQLSLLGHSCSSHTQHRSISHVAGNRSLTTPQTAIRYNPKTSSSQKQQHALLTHHKTRLTPAQLPLRNKAAKSPLHTRNTAHRSQRPHRTTAGVLSRRTQGCKHNKGSAHVAHCVAVQGIQVAAAICYCQDDERRQQEAGSKNQHNRVVAPLHAEPVMTAATQQQCRVRDSKGASPSAVCRPHLHHSTACHSTCRKHATDCSKALPHSALHPPVPAAPCSPFAAAGAA